jgi:hypothetical protein
VEDPAQKAVRDYLKRDRKYHRGTGPLATLAMVGTIIIVAFFTQPWPRLGRGSKFDGDMWRPLLAVASGFVAALLVIRMMRRRSPLRPPPFTDE